MNTTTHNRTVSQIFSIHKSTVQNQSELIATHNGYVGKELANGQQTNVLSVMQSGCKLLKLCKRGTRSHWRKFQLDSNNEKMYWVSDKKDVNDTTIYICNITEIVCHSIDIVNKFKDTLPEELTHNAKELQQQQFTIRYLEHNSDRTNNFDDSYTKSDSPANKPSNYIYIYDHDTNNTNNNNTNTSFWEKLLNSTIVHKQSEEDIIDTDKHQHESNNTSTDSNSEDNDYHLQELHLMAENPRIATIWAYGLECLIKLHDDGIDISKIPMSQFKISVKELMNYKMDKNNDPSDLQINKEKVQQFKTRLEEINDKLYSIIEQMPNYCTLLENDAIDNFDDDFFNKKIKKDQNDLETVLYEASLNKFDKDNLKQWSYILTRIDINCGAYTIAINQKHDHRNRKALQLKIMKKDC